MTGSIISFFCCDAHVDAYVEARRRSRAGGIEWTPEEIKSLSEIEEHLRELNGTATRACS
jgi:hypothetical protein